MKPSETCKKHGITFADLRAATGESQQCLYAMHKNQPRRFELLCKGVFLEQLEKINDK